MRFDLSGQNTARYQHSDSVRGALFHSLQLFHKKKKNDVGHKITVQVEALFSYKYCVSHNFNVIFMMSHCSAGMKLVEVILVCFERKVTHNSVL